MIIHFVKIFLNLENCHFLIQFLEISSTLSFANRREFFHQQQLGIKSILKMPKKNRDWNSLQNDHNALHEKHNMANNNTKRLNGDKSLGDADGWRLQLSKNSFTPNRQPLDDEYRW